ncbi:hypothetical protein UFOVP112_336 [uncultured Caudovirales phage]|uniref:Uncharacterized protein n=1 Tax=uncultured Caudovirales phage TaxID=2100421 RepID=A0A6J5L3G0_9CAUD|nr:hypothetical protein UFOVP112_336 [uncultured Caudovirales phage]
MNPQVEAMANQAVFHLQFNTRDAVRYVQRNTGTDQATAQQAVKAVVVFHK